MKGNCNVVPLESSGWLQPISYFVTRQQVKLCVAMTGCQMADCQSLSLVHCHLSGAKGEEERGKKPKTKQKHMHDVSQHTHKHSTQTSAKAHALSKHIEKVSGSRHLH